MPDAPNVNVIFHGLFLFVKQKGFMDVLITNMGHDHVYRAGTFLAEETLMPAPISTPYFLDGVTGGDASFDTSNNIVFDDKDFNHRAPASEVYARLVLPIPIEIVSLRPTEDALEADYDPDGVVDGKNPCGVQILRYHADDLDAVALPPHEATLGKNKGGTVLNLHIISEPDSEMVHEDHVRNGFERTLHLLRGVDTPIFIRNLTALSLLKTDDTTRGFAAIETLDVRERALMLALAGIDWRDRKSHTGLPDDVLADVPPQDCMPIISDNGDH